MILEKARTEVSKVLRKQLILKIEAIRKFTLGNKGISIFNPKVNS